MEQGNWNVDEMLHWLDMKINREDRNIREQSKKMNENFLHFFIHLLALFTYDE